MSLVSIGTALFPADPAAQGAVGSLSAITATTHRHGFVFNPPVAGTLDSYAFLTRTVTTAADLRIRVETIDSAGHPTGTLVAAGADASVVTPASDTWYTVNFATPPTVAVGTRVAIVIDAPSGSPSLVIARAGGSEHNSNHTSSFTTSWQSRSAVASIGAIKISGVWVPVDNIYPFSYLSDESFSSSSTPDEKGNKFIAPSDMEVEGLWARMNQNNNPLAASLYDASTNEIATGAIPFNGGTGRNILRFATPVAITAGETYRATVRPTSTSNINLITGTIGDTSQWNALHEGRFKYTHRTDAGSWTDSTTEFVCMGLVISKVHESSGGATGRYKAKVDGVVIDIL